MEFLRARYTEAREREEAKRTLRDDVPFEFTWSYEMDRAYVEIGSLKQRMAAEDFWAQYGVSAADPDVLADLDAKLRLIDWVEWPGGLDTRDAYEWTMAVLAVPFAKHPDYDQRWTL